MNVLLLLLGIIFVVYVLPAVLSTSNLQESSKKEPCKIHKWEYRGERPNQHMVCAECKKRPGLNSDRESE